MQRLEGVWERLQEGEGVLRMRGHLNQALFQAEVAPFLALGEQPSREWGERHLEEEAGHLQGHSEHWPFCSWRPLKVVQTGLKLAAGGILQELPRFF